ncbi:hypothetical protein QAD02_005440 [Eretmocerus hayati]|uniref:Uncharacterized protein n=2 Tax=Eretmocerus hayati TaxID=131215 RepID=A0ACC2NQS0_9HYME|nr:hypothetical protein QAD02_004785 [Eretmocerus hayati]KAJ8674178.1 hypothetical protein QAD02_005440 [Eretmocerus hayati]
MHRDHRTENETETIIQPGSDAPAFAKFSRADQRREQTRAILQVSSRGAPAQMSPGDWPRRGCPQPVSTDSTDHLIRNLIRLTAETALYELSSQAEAPTPISHLEPSLVCVVFCSWSCRLALVDADNETSTAGHGVG